jgi:hypothetical protein
MLAPTRDDLRAEQQGGVSLWYIAGRLGRSDRSQHWVVRHVERLIDGEAFPKPLPDYRAGRKRAGINNHSRWLRTAVDAWFDGLIPPHLVPVVESRQAANDAARLDQRAAELATGAQR